MGHIHTEPNQHDFTTSAYIIRKVDDEWKCLVHHHKKLGKLLQIGGHIELTETPWQALAHEIREESGYDLSELRLLQPKSISTSIISDAIVHPLPLLLNTHTFSSDHFHTDLGYGFIAKHTPSRPPHMDESQDIRWYSLSEIEVALAADKIIPDIAITYRQLLGSLESYKTVDPASFSLECAKVFKATHRELSLTQFGNPILRQVARPLSAQEITSDEIQQLITDIRYTNQTKSYGVGLAAPQVGVGIALSVIGIKPTPNRPNLTPFEQVIINPSYGGIGKRIGMWEGCQSSGTGHNTLYGKALRYRKIKAFWLDERGETHEQTLDGFVAHVFQHETDHLNGILFVDRVRDTKTYMLADEFRERIVKPSQID